MNPHYAEVAARASRRCEYCHAPEVIFNFHFEVEHIVPTSRAGNDDQANLALACHACNLFKRDFIEGVDDETGAISLLFHPRHDIWNEHFSVVPELGAIAGLTAVGRATVARLRFNTPRQSKARKHWIRLGLFP